MDYEKRARGIIDAASASEGVIREVDYDLALEAIEETLRESYEAGRDEARAEVDSWRESSDAGWAKFDECRDDLKEARAEVARLRDLLLTGEWGRHVDDGRTFLRVYVADGADLSCRATREDAINAVLAAADTNKEGGA